MAIDLLFERVGRISRISPVYKTPALGFRGADFLNCVICVSTPLKSSWVLRQAMDIERQLGRKPRTGANYEDRPIDIDILMNAEELVDSEFLFIPHVQMAHRRFVLQPMADIAGDVVHPIEKKTIAELLEITADNSIVEKQQKWLRNPLADFDLDTHHYIAIEGNIGAGKTTLVEMIAQDFEAKAILERFKDNPFLPKFYKDAARYAFPLEMSFLADRYQQLLDDIGQYNLFNKFMVADYDSHKSLVFAKITLTEEEYELYRKLHGMMYKDLAKPNLLIYLYQDTERLLTNIAKRGRAYEKDISKEYLTKINAGYLDYLRSLPQERVRIIDISGMDFVKNREDYLKILKSVGEREVLKQH